MDRRYNRSRGEWRVESWKLRGRIASSVSSQREGEWVWIYNENRRVGLEFVRVRSNPPSRIRTKNQPGMTTV